jgi:hypothetical protein
MLQECHPLDRDVRCAHVRNRILAFIDVTGSPGVYEVAITLPLNLVLNTLALLTFVLTSGKGLLQVSERGQQHHVLLCLLDRALWYNYAT